jgi:hypothetical protein
LALLVSVGFVIPVEASQKRAVVVVVESARFRWRLRRRLPGGEWIGG